MEVNIDLSGVFGTSARSPERQRQSVAGLAGSPERRRQSAAAPTIGLDGSSVGSPRRQELSWAACDCPDDCPRDHEND
jgi:hypothetical protein